MKRIVVSSLVSLFVLSCSVTVPNNPSKINEDFSDLEKEYKSFSTKALSNVYVKRVFDKFLTVSPNPTQVIRQLEFARYLKGKSDTSYFDSLKTIIANENSIYTKIITTSGVSQKMTSESGTFGVFVQSISPLPGVPVATSATGITSTSFTANWNAVSDATSYIISIDGVETTLGNVTTYTKSGLTAGTTHTYSVKAVNSGGTGTNSNTINVALAPPIPTALAASSITSIAFTANWGSVTTATGYKLTVDGTETDVGLVTSKSVTGLTAGSTHTYSVKAYNASSTGDSSSTITIVTIPAAPTANVASSVTSTSFTANWSTVTGATGYKLFVDGTQYPNSSTIINTNSKSVTGVPSNSTHNYYVISVNSSGVSSNSNTISFSTPAPRTVSTFAGTGVAGYNDSIRANAWFSGPDGIAVDSSGNFYVSDTSNNRIRKISSAGVVTTLAGDGTYSFLDGTGTNARFRNPRGIAVDSSGNLYVADSGNHRIRKITTAGVVTTLAGNGTYGFQDGTGTNAQFRSPSGIAIDSTGNLYVTDSYNYGIRKITSEGVVTTFAGNSIGSADGTGTNATFNNPGGIAIDSTGNLYVADTGNNKIRKITSEGVVTTFAGGANLGYIDGIGTTAGFDSPYGIALDLSGNIYVTSNGKIRIITSAGAVSDFAGTGYVGSTDGDATIARFNYPSGLVVDSSGNVYVADSGNNKIRKIQ